MRIAFFGHFGRGNFGNESTLLAMLSWLRQALPEAEFSCICTGPEAIGRRYGIRTVPSREAIGKGADDQSPSLRRARKLALGLPREVYRWVRSLKTLWKVDALIIPGTGLLTDAHTLLEWGPYDMFRWSLAAKLSGSKLLFISVGAGPLYSRLGRFFVKSALGWADFRSYRDNSTQRFLTGIGFPAARDLVYPDLVFSLPVDVPSDGPSSSGRRLVVGLGLMEYAGKYSVERPTAAVRSAYLESLVQFVKWLLIQGYDIRLLIGDIVDLPAIEEFKYLLKMRGVSLEGGRVIDEPVTSIGNLLAQLAATDWVVATRFHNVLLAMVLNKPVLAISFHHKCTSLMIQMGMKDYCLDFNCLDGDDLAVRFRDLQQNADAIKQVLREKVEDCRAELDGQYKTVLSTVCPDRRHARVTEIQSSGSAASQ